MKILDTAWRIARDEGFTSLSRNRLAEECNVSSGSVSHLLGNMDAAYQYVLDRAHKERVKLTYRKQGDR